LNTFIWNGNFQKEIHGNEWDAEFYQHIRSRYIKSDKIAIQDEYQGIISLRTRLSERWSLQLNNTSNVVADNRVIDLGRMAQHQVLAGFEYMPFSMSSVQALVGYELNSQENERDRGFSYKLGFDSRNIQLEEFDVSLQSYWNQSFLGRRSPRTGGMHFQFLRDFGGGVEDSLIIDYGVQRREFYSSLSLAGQQVLGVQHNIFQRDARVLEVANQIKYHLNQDFSLNVVGGISNTNIDRGYRFIDPTSVILDTRIQEIQFYGNISLQWNIFDWLESYGKLSYTEREERHSVSNRMTVTDTVFRKQQASANRLENAAQRTMWTLGLMSKPTDYDRISLTSSAGILQYDTPDSTNTDDRDELLVTTGIEYIHVFSNQLKLSIVCDLTLFHMVYIHRDQSANNNWNRVIRFSPSIEYTPTSWLRMVTRTEVLANYTVSDYEEQVASIKSFSYRQAMWSDSTSLQLTDKILCNFSGSLRIFERGTLRWKEFIEKPEDYFVEKAFWPELIWTSDYGLKVGIGYRYFSQDRYRFQDSKKHFNQGIEAVGPTVVIEWIGLGKERMRINGWLEEQKRNQKTIATISNLSIQVEFIL